MTIIPSYACRRMAWVVLIRLVVWPVWGQDTINSFDVKAHYEKHEYQIAMRDGVRLFTAVFTPRDRSKTYPILLLRTPYGVTPYGEDAYPKQLLPTAQFAEAGYVFVLQDVRGRYRSEGQFVHMTPQRKSKRGPKDVDESTDAYDTIDWLVNNVPGNNGRVGLWGGSYAGFFASAGMIDAHPALKAVSPEAPQTDWFIGDDTHHNGAFFLTSTFNFMAQCGRRSQTTSTSCGNPFDFGTPDGYKFFLDMGPLSKADTRFFHREVPGWTEMMEHGAYDQFWQSRNILPHLRNIRPAVLSVGGWYDANNFYGALHVYESVERQSPGTPNTLVIGPWSHGQWLRANGEALGALHFGTTTSVFFQENILFPFFEHYLKEKDDPKLPKAYVFETGSNRWRTFGSWPPNNVRPESIYLHEDGALSFVPPRKSLATAYDAYVSDPARPVPFISKLSTQMDPDYMAQDQRFATTRPDVLVYQSDILAQNVTIAGPVAPSLFVSTSGTDSDWIVKLIDVYPDDAVDGAPAAGEFCIEEAQRGGFQQLVRGDVLRGKFRNSFERPEPLTPGKITKIEFAMPDVLHTFLKGHRIMIHIQSTWFPLVDRNPQIFGDIYRARASDFRKATERVFRSNTERSRVQINVLEDTQ